MLTWAKQPMYFVTNLASPFTIHPSALVINENKLLIFS